MDGRPLRCGVDWALHLALYLATTGMAEKWNEEKKERIGINCALLSYSTRNDVCHVLGNFSVVLEKKLLI